MINKIQLINYGLIIKTEERQYPSYLSLVMISNFQD
jgi:hypothetical protein